MKISDIKNIGALKAYVVGEYKLHYFSEKLSPEGNKIICKQCGGVKMVKAYSDLLQCYVWNQVHRNDSGEITHDGCGCYNAKAKKMATQRAEYKKYEGNDIFYDWDGLNRHLASVPYPVASIRDRFYMQHYTDGVAIMRDSIYEWEETGIGESVYFYGEPERSFKTSLMCCLRRSLLTRGTSCFMVTPQQIADILKHGKYDRELSMVDVLIIDDLGRLRINERLSEEILRVLKERNDNCRHTIFASRYKKEELQERGYTKELVKFISKITGTGIELSTQMSEGGSEWH